MSNDKDEGGEEAFEELAREKKRNEELLSRLKYLQADFENLRKRTDKEVREAGEASQRTLAGKLLVVLDELQLAVKHASEPDMGAELVEGIEMVEKNLEGILESVGVERIDCVGKPFDPALHEAAEKVQGKKEGEDLVVEELRPGYVLRGQLLRPSMVKVQLGLKPTAEAWADE
ncbi:MAG TPA: nucleotide exchange factor GrpE [Nitrososphaerales archaeon]|nr:nucleotide exchange factor GrpE [Nitrososphaerales archaeon]